MNLKKILAGVLACCVVGGAFSAISMPADNSAIAASAVDDEDYTVGTYEQLFYYNYGDHIEILHCDESATSVVIPTEIDGVPVTHISDWAFNDCSGLTEIIIPNSVTSIGEGAFNYCTELTEITIPDSVTSIGDYTFRHCEGLTEITIPNSVTSFGVEAFAGTPWLNAKRAENPLVIVNGFLIEGYTCTGNVVIPDSVTSTCN